MANVVILTDTVLNGELGAMRYAGAYAIASSLRKANISTVVVDHFTKNQNLVDCLKLAITKETAVLAISSTFLAPYISLQEKRRNRNDTLKNYYSGELWFENGTDLLKWCKTIKTEIRKINPEIKLILGGVKSQFAIWRSEFYSEFDYICIGSADKSFPRFVANLINKTQPKTKELQGKENLIDNSIDLISKTCPDTIWQETDCVQFCESLPIEVSRGCAFGCKFCHYDKKESLKKSTALLRDEFIRNFEKFGTTIYSFCDDCFNDTRKKVEDYCNLFLGLPFKIEWTAYARVDVAVKFPETVDLMVASGARGLYWGLESFDPIVSRSVGKGTPTELVKDFLLNFKAKFNGVCLSEGSFIVGLPGETRESLLLTLEWIIRNDPLDLVTFGPLGLMPYVPTLDKVLFDYAEYSKSPEKYGFRNVQFRPHFWEHDQMNSNEANELSTYMAFMCQLFNPKGFLRSIWLYPHCRSLGYDHFQCMEAFGSTSKKDEIATDLVSRFKKFVKRYNSDLMYQLSKKNLEQLRYE